MNIRLLFFLSLFITFNCAAIQGQQTSEMRHVVRLKATVDVRTSLDFDSFSLESFLSSKSSLFDRNHNLMLVVGKKSWQFIDLTTGNTQWTLSGLQGLPVLSPTTQRLLVLGRKKSAQLLNARTGEKLCEIAPLKRQIAEVTWSPDENSFMILTQRDSYWDTVRDREKTVVHMYTSASCTPRFSLEVNTGFSPRIIQPGFANDSDEQRQRECEALGCKDRPTKS